MFHWQVFWLDVYFDLPVHAKPDSGVRKVAFLLERPSYSYGDSSGIKPDSLLIQIHFSELRTNFAANVGGNNLKTKSLKMTLLGLIVNKGLIERYELKNVNL